jgi:hypothetical protein
MNLCLKKLLSDHRAILNLCAYRFAGGPRVGGGRATSADLLFCCWGSGTGGFGETISACTESRLLSRVFMVPVINPAWPQKHW